MIAVGFVLLFIGVVIINLDGHGKVPVAYRNIRNAEKIGITACVFGLLLIVIGFAILLWRYAP